jgi:hypothetical protein
MTPALEVYCGHVATINAKLEQLSKLANYHFGHDDEDIGWGHVMDIAGVEKELDELLRQWVERADRVKLDKRLDEILGEKE